MKRLSILALTLFTCNAQVLTLSLHDAIETALTHNPALHVAKADINASQGVLTQARSSYLPQLNVSGGVLYDKVDSPLQNDPESVLNLNATATQLIYDFGTSTGGIDAASYELNASQVSLETSVSDIVLQTHTDYYGTLKNRYLIRVALESLEIASQQLYQSKEYFKAGVRTKIDVTNAKVEHSNAELDLLNATQNLQLSRIALETVMGKRPNNGNYVLMLENQEIETMAASLEGFKGTLDDLIDTAYAKRPEFESLGAQHDALKATLHSKDGEYFPTLFAQGKYSDYESDIALLNDEWSAGVYLNWDIFSGFRTDGEMQELRSNLLSLEAQQRRLKLQVRKEVSDAYVQTTQLEKAVGIAKLSTQLAKENLELAEQRYKNGIGDIIEYNDAKVKYTSAKSNLVASYFDYLSALATLKYATGAFRSYM